jgi:hypothetical protein
VGTTGDEDPEVPANRELKLHCVTVDTSVMDFVVKAIEEKLAGSGGRPARARGKKA